METHISDQDTPVVKKITRSSSIESFSSQTSQSDCDMGIKGFQNVDQKEKHQAQIEWNGIKQIINKKRKPKRVGSGMFNFSKDDKQMSSKPKHINGMSTSNKILEDQDGKAKQPVARAFSSKNMVLMNQLKHSSNSLMSSVDQGSEVDSYQFQQIKAVKVAKLQQPCGTTGFNLGDVPFANNTNWEDSSAGSDFEQIAAFGSKNGSSKYVVQSKSGSSRNVGQTSESKKEPSKFVEEDDLDSDSMSQDSVSSNSSQEDTSPATKTPTRQSSQKSLSKGSSEQPPFEEQKKTDLDIQLQAKKVINFNINKKTQMKYGMSSTKLMEKIQEANTPSAEISTPSQNVNDAEGNTVNSLMIKSKFKSVQIQKE